MKARQTQGFTIIEVILFLAISALMMVGIIAAVSSTINQRRYTDAVRSAEDYLKGQYGLVTDVRNNRPSTYTCSPSGIASGTSNPGTATCTIVGRYIDVANDGTIKSEPVYARADITGASVTGAANENDMITNMNLVRAPAALATDNVSYKIPWDIRVQAKLAAGGSKVNGFRMLIVQLPTGVVRTFTTITSGAFSIAAIRSNAAVSDVSVCIDPNGLVATKTQEITIKAGATSASAIQHVGESSSC